MSDDSMAIMKGAPNGPKDYVILGTIHGYERVIGRPKVKRREGMGWPKRDTDPISQPTERFRVRFLTEVLERTDIAWYVDYFSADVEQFNVNYFAVSPLIHWTDENLKQRDPDNLEGSQWHASDVEAWFSSDGSRRPKGTYAHTLKFEAGHTSETSVHTIRIQKGSVIVNGNVDEKAWDRYVEQGIRGALSDFRITKLLSLTIEKVDVSYEL